MSITVPNGFHVTAYEQRRAGIRVHEEIPDHVRFVPATFADFKERVEKIKQWRDDHVADAKCADAESDTHLVVACRGVVRDIDEVLTTWRARWRACANNGER